MKENIEEDIEVMANIITHYIEADKCGLSNNDFKKEIKALSNILSDYKRLLKENEELKKQNYDLLRKLKNRVKEVRKLEKYSMYKKEFSTLNKKVNELQKENEYLYKMIKEYKIFGDLDNLEYEKVLNELHKLIKERDDTNEYRKSIKKL